MISIAGDIPKISKNTGEGIVRSDWLKQVMIRKGFLKEVAFQAEPSRRVTYP